MKANKLKTVLVRTKMRDQYHARASKEVLQLWDRKFETKECFKENPIAACLKRQSLNRARKIKLTSQIRRTASNISDIASKELESSALHMQTDTRTLDRTENVLNRTERWVFLRFVQ